MDALILAAGRGERLRPLTDTLPKPLLQAGEQTLIEHRVAALVAAGITDIVVNTAHLGAMIIEHLGDGSRLGARIRYSDESAGALETGGGIVKALALLHSDPFLVINGDIWTDYPVTGLLDREIGLAHLVLVDNPAHHPQGDFCLRNGRVLPPAATGNLTFSGIGMYCKALFSGDHPSRFSLAPLLLKACADHQVSGEHYRGRWIDVGTPQRLAELRAWLERKS